jgi:hypothetical protein
MRLARLLVLFLAFIVFEDCRAQLRIDTTSLYQLGHSVVTGTTDSINIRLYNDDTIPIHDTITLGYRVDTSVHFGPDAFVNFSALIAIDSLGPHDSILVPVTFHFNPPRFSAPGPSVIVIWPISLTNPNIACLDSARDTLYSIISNIVDPRQHRLNVFVLGGQLYIQAGDTEVLQRVRIFDIRGALVMQQGASGNTEISLNTYAAGIYFAEVLFEDNTRQVYKIFNSGF